MSRTFLNLKSLTVFCAAIFAMTLAACMPSGKQNVNTELFQDKNDLHFRAALLKPGMTRQQTFEALQISPEKFERMSAQDVQMSIYGNSQVQGSPEQLEAFKKKMLTYEGYALPYREIKSNSSLGLGKMKVNKTGYDLKLVLIFERNRLLRSTVEGTQNVNQEEDEYLWGKLLKSGISAAF